MKIISQLSSKYTKVYENGQLSVIRKYADGFEKVITVWNKEGVWRTPSRKKPLVLGTFMKNAIYLDFSYIYSPKMSTADEYMLRDFLDGEPNKYIYQKYIDTSEVFLWHDIALLKSMCKIPQTETLIGMDGGLRLLDRSRNIWKRATKAERVRMINNLREYNTEYSWLYLRDLSDTLRTPYENMLDSQKSMPNPMDNNDNYYDIPEKDLRWVINHSFPDMDWGNTSQARYRECVNVIGEYRDYLWLAACSGHDIQDPYWSRNRDWVTIHDVLVNERSELTSQEKAKKIEAFTKRYSEYSSYVVCNNDLKIYISNEIDVWKNHAKALGQCIVSCGYWDKKSSIIIFVERNGNPDSTFEYSIERKSIIQKYADEHNRKADTLYPKDDANALVEQFCDMYLRK